MFRKRRREIPGNSSEHFMKNLYQQAGKHPGAMFKIERLPQGTMQNHMVAYVPAYRMNIQRGIYGIEEEISQSWGGGTYNLAVVDEERRPLTDVENLWLSVAYTIEEIPEDELEIKKNKATGELLVAVVEHSLARTKQLQKDRIDHVKEIAQIVGDSKKEQGEMAAMTMKTILALALRRRNDQKTLKFLEAIASVKSSAQQQRATQRAAAANQIQQLMQEWIQQSGQPAGQQPVPQMEPTTLDAQTQREPQPSISQSGPQHTSNMWMRPMPLAFAPPGAKGGISAQETSKSTEDDQDTGKDNESGESPLS